MIHLVWRRLVLCSLLLGTAIASPAYALRGDPAAPPLVRVAAAAAPLEATDSYRLALLKMKGHLSVARALLQLRTPGANYHLGSPMRSTFQTIETELDNRGAPFTADILDELENAPAAEPLRALATLESAVTAVDGSFAQTGAMDAASVLALAEALLREAVANYAEAVTDNEVVDLTKYQSGRGFVTEAEALVRHASPLKGRPAHAKLLDVVTLIRQAWPGVIPPPIVFDPASVAGRLDEAVAVMEELR